MLAKMFPLSYVVKGTTPPLSFLNSYAVLLMSLVGTIMSEELDIDSAVIGELDP